MVVRLTIYEAIYACNNAMIYVPRYRWAEESKVGGCMIDWLKKKSSASENSDIYFLVSTRPIRPRLTHPLDEDSS